MAPKEDIFYTLIVDESKLAMKFNGTEITTVVPGGWADRNGVELDDEIHEVGGKLFEPMTRQEKLAALQAARPITVKFKRPAIKDAYYTLTFNEEKLGMGFKGSRVSSCAPGGWAERAGVVPGDEITEVAARPFGQLTDQEKIACFKSPKPYDLKFKRPAHLARHLEEQSNAANGYNAPAIGANKNNAGNNKAGKEGFFSKMFGFCCSSDNTSTTNDVVVGNGRF